MKKFSISLVAVLAMATLAACGDDSMGDDDDDDDDDDDVVDVDSGTTGERIDVPAGDIDEDTTWTADNTYVLKGQVFVTAGTLTIEAGTRIEGDNGAALTITTGGQIDATGTAAAPIVFTSSQATPASGDWSGLVLLGLAEINVQGGTESIEGFPDSVGTRSQFGGDDDTHDCGTLRYVRIEYAGFALSTDNELNALTVGGCGSDTELDFIQAHRGLDDGIEFFGGSANLRHAVVSLTDDDGIDWDFGWTGTVQFAIIQQSSARGNRGFESDNNGNDNDALPRSAPRIWNVTLIGGNGAPEDAQGGMHLRRGTAGRIHNAIVAYFPSYAIDIDGASTVAQLDAGELLVEDSWFFPADGGDLWPAGFDVSEKVENDCVGDVCIDEEGFFGDATNNTLGEDPELEDPTSTTAPDFAPAAGSPVLTGGGTPGAGFDASATFIGAIGADDWTEGWTSFPQ